CPPARLAGKAAASTRRTGPWHRPPASLPSAPPSQATQGKEGGMRIDVKGRNVAVGDEMRERIEKRFQKIGRQVSELAHLDVELKEEKNPSIRDSCVAEATLHLKGVTLRAHSAADNMASAINEMSDDLLHESFALTREAAKRTLGQRHFDVQLIGGMVLHDGSISEMKTGEGKTLTATLPVVLNALAGNGVHLVTVNDYLARRDAEWMRPIYEMLGVRVSYLTSEERDPADKRAAYAADVTYGTNSEF